MKKHEEELEQQNAELKQQLEDRTLRLKQTGSIAEAALALNHGFEAAQAAADDYLNSIKAADPQPETASEQDVETNGGTKIE